MTGGAVNCTRDAAGSTSGVCETTGDANTPRTFTAAPAAGAVASWSGCDSTPTPTTCVVSASAARTVTATFVATATGPGEQITAVPTLGEWGLLLLGLLAAGLGARRLRRG